MRYFSTKPPQNRVRQDAAQRAQAHIDGLVVLALLLVACVMVIAFIIMSMVPPA